ncbi:uncharacterized protein LOC133194564 [Saccostrea echinata]|uniref:uncharacterized protein LOC133194564 n=1 Tax=Saccostrea echinata TaxID=191078 RepID=UPI002A81FDA4|nr:uncharacterized protein LOC133194564 [Saccostrea echinata]
MFLMGIYVIIFATNFCYSGGHFGYKYKSVDQRRVTKDANGIPICGDYDYGFIAHPEYCQAYYDCSSTSGPLYRPWDKGFRECPYPKLFNAQTLKCEMFFYVKCGKRKEYKSGCDYFANQCLRSHCIPCFIRYPSCEGYRDGTHEHPIRRGSKWMIHCYRERLMNSWYG